ncbi:MAG: multiprotein-bridging factor 1 family protein, partial [Candidatus Weimeria sp.]
GDVLGISDKVISKWENGKAKPNIAYVESIEQILGINIKSEYKPKNKKTLSLKVFVLILIAAVISSSLCLIFYFNSKLDRMKAYYEKNSSRQAIRHIAILTFRSSMHPARNIL